MEVDFAESSTLLQRMWSSQLSTFTSSVSSKVNCTNYVVNLIDSIRTFGDKGGIYVCVCKDRGNEMVREL